MAKIEGKKAKIVQFQCTPEGNEDYARIFWLTEDGKLRRQMLYRTNYPVEEMNPETGKWHDLGS
jgi:hypothetical protein